MTDITYGNGLLGSIGYDNQYRISALTVGTAGTILNYTYTHDANGNIMAINDALEPAKNKSFTYDVLDRLATATSTGIWGSLGWTYDGVGNRQTENANSYTYLPNTNKLNTVGGITYGFDNNGNTTAEGARQFTYNQNQRLIQVVDAGVTKGEYVYNGNGQRVKKIVEGVTTIFHYSLSGQIIAESASSGAVTAEYVYLNSSPLAKIEGSNVYYYHNDHLGTPQKMTDGTGTVVWSADYKPFGEATITVSSITNNLRFPGQYYDAETGLHYNYFRDYNPIIGRYIEADPIGIQRGTNHLYIYANGNPLRFIDPKGLACGSGPTEYIVPDGYGPGSNHYSFVDACTKHDKCYGTCKASKASCDVDFLFNMRSVCNSMSGFAYVDCMAMAHTYYLAVALFGDISYNIAQHTACKCKK